jgi:hypothetical protein
VIWSSAVGSGWFNVARSVQCEWCYLAWLVGSCSLDTYNEHRLNINILYIYIYISI